jgi:F-type H+-transporting ATPase subunit gamma
MANLKEIRLRINSVKNTRKITQAMSRIASARLARAQSAMESARQYGERMREVVGAAVSEVDDPASAHPLLVPRAEIKREAFVLVTADKGLCGGFNTNPSRLAVRLMQDAKREGREVDLVCVGKKGVSYATHRGFEPRAVLEAPASETIVDVAAQAMQHCQSLFTGEGEGQADRVHLVFNRFKNVITQEVVAEQLLPVNPEDLMAAAEDSKAVRSYEPDVGDLLAHLVPVAVETQIQQALFNSVAAELAARRMAMDSATDNAGELIKELTLMYNRERQAAITTELMEIVGGSEALKG